MTYSLRDLPLPVKVVASVFLMAVGTGYTSAMVQLHMQDAKSGKPMPTVADVILKYTGKKKRDPNAPAAAPISRLEALVTNPTVVINGQSMSAAFTTADRAKGELKYSNAIKGKPAELVEIIQAQRAGEQKVFKLWINLPDAERRAAYEGDKFEVPADQMPTQMTNAFRAGTTVKIKSIIDARCATCHAKGDPEKGDVPLDHYDGLAKFMAVDVPAPTGDWVKVEEPISVTKLTQSTHAHLLSFAVLFSLTGLVFAMSSYPTGLRCVLGPWVVIAVFADVSLWWLARLCDQWGPYFAMGIIATGGLAGAGLFGQIVLSLFNMYGTKGKAVIGGFFVAGAVIAGLVWVNKIDPALSQKPPADVKPEPLPGNGPKAPPVPEDNGNKEIVLPTLTEEQKKELRDAWGDLSGIDAAKLQAARQKCDQILGETTRKGIEQLLKDAKSEAKATRDAALPKLDKVRESIGLAPVGGGPVVPPPIPAAPPSHMERMLTFPVKGPDGAILPMDQTPWAGGDDGNMSRAFFDKDKVFDQFMKGANPQPAKDKLMTERDGERMALIAWIRGADAPRKAAYDADSFTLPAELAGKPITAKYVKGDKVSVKTIIADRCLRCHGPEGKQYDDYPLDTYEHWKKYMTPPAPAVPEVPPKGPTDAPPAPKPANPIPDAKDD